IPGFDGRHLVVDGKPYLLLGGELANSSAASRAYMSPNWAKLRHLHLNTVLMPVSWELIQPQEGRFDFRLVDGLLNDARAAGLRVVILWFGSWKNGQSSYVPEWVKRDSGRFPRARDAAGRAVEVLSPFSDANRDADTKAFARLMAHLAATDRRRTCIMVQVENEIGLMPMDRDRSEAAEQSWKQPVPGELPGAGKTWEDAFGADAGEAFMAYGYSRYVEAVAKAGKKAYALPMYVNASLPQTGGKAGHDFPSGGPLPEVAAIWRREAPSIDLLAPDIYAENVTHWAALYKTFSPLFIPEANWAGRPGGPADALLAIGRFDAIGYSPFSVDTIDAASLADLSSLYALLEPLSTLILSRQGTPDIAGFRPETSVDGKADLSPRSVVMGRHVITAHFIDPWTVQAEHEPQNRGAILMKLGPDSFMAVGRGVTFTFAPADDAGSDGIAAIDAGDYRGGEWREDHRLNGDDSYAGRHVRLPFDRQAVLRFELYHYH
ncbi:MAG: DUF5597 domain-containing protein, partial [Asticcacaulis sp.]